MSPEPTLLLGTEKALRKSFEETVALEELSRDAMHGAEQIKAKIQVCCPAVHGDRGDIGQQDALRDLAGVSSDFLYLLHLEGLSETRPLGEQTWL